MASQVDSLGVMGGKCGAGCKSEGGKQICASNPSKKRAEKPETEKKSKDERVAEELATRVEDSDES